MISQVSFNISVISVKLVIFKFMPAQLMEVFKNADSLVSIFGWSDSVALKKSRVLEFCNAF